MLRYEDLPSLYGVEDDVHRAQAVRFACLRTVQQTQQRMMSLVAHHHMTFGEYHARAHMIRVVFCVYRQALWWLRPFRLIEHDLHASFHRLTRARHRVIEGHDAFLFRRQDAAFAQWLTEQVPAEPIYLEEVCSTCGSPTEIRLGPAPFLALPCLACQPTRLVSSSSSSQTSWPDGARTVSMPTLPVSSPVTLPLRKSGRTFLSFARIGA